METIRKRVQAASKYATNRSLRYIQCDGSVRSQFNRSCSIDYSCIEDLDEDSAQRVSQLHVEYILLSDISSWEFCVGYFAHTLVSAIRPDKEDWRGGVA